AETLGFVMTREPEWAALPDATPPRIRSLLRRALTRDPRARLRDIGEARILIASPDEPEAAPARASSIGLRAAAVASVAAFALGATAAGLVVHRTAPAAAALR